MLFSISMIPPMIVSVIYLDGAFEAFFNAFAAQQRFIIEHTTTLNNMAGEAYAYLRPTPLLSTAIRGAIENATVVTRGGAIYNTSGSFNIGLSDVVDSLMVIKKLVYDEKKVSFQDLKKAIDPNFENDPFHAHLSSFHVASSFLAMPSLDCFSFHSLASPSMAYLLLLLFFHSLLSCHYYYHHH